MTARCAIENVTDALRRADARRPALARAAAAGLARRFLQRRRSASSAPATSRSDRARVLARARLVRRRARLGAAPPDRGAAGAVRPAARRPARISASSTSATGRSSRCASRSATGCGARTCRPTGRRCRPGSSASSPSTRATSSAATPCCASASRASTHALSLPRGRRRRSRRSRATSPSTPFGERPIAYVSSGGYGHTIERSIALAYLPVEHAPVGTELTVGILGERRRAVVCEQPLLDPAGERLLS